MMIQRGCFRLRCIERGGGNAQRRPDAAETRGNKVEMEGKEILQLYRIKTNEDVRDKTPPPLRAFSYNRRYIYE